MGKKGWQEVRWCASVRGSSLGRGGRGSLSLGVAQHAPSPSLPYQPMSQWGQLPTGGGPPPVQLPHGLRWTLVRSG